MKNIYLIIAMWLCLMCADAQISQQYVIASIGGFTQTSMGSAAYTAGEMSMVKTFTGGGYILTQGFEQGYISSALSGGHALPVTLIDFTGFYSASIDHLTWQTASELDNDHFEVERLNSTGDFIYLGSVKGFGTTDIEHSYTFNDPEPAPGDNYYRLKQVDVDGNFTYSDVISIAVPITNMMNVSIYPNPAKDYVNLLVSTSEGQTAMLTVSDIIGKVIYTEQVALSPGSTSMHLDMSGYEQGEYFIKFCAGASITNTKVIKQ